MPRSKTPTVNLEEAKARFGQWRQNRIGKARIPAELWSAAVEVARKEGINRTARELHVAWDDLKRRMTITGEVGGNRVRRHLWNWSHRRRNRFPNAFLKWKGVGASCESS